MAHFRHHHRQITLTVPRPDVRALIRRTAHHLRLIEQTAERHWPMAAYTVLTVAAAVYVIVQLTTVTR